jgi:hypothetical protein
VKSKVDGHPNLVKDSVSGVIHNRESNDRDRYRTAKRQALMNLDSQTEIARLSSELDEIKSLLKQLVNK